MNCPKCKIPLVPFNLLTDDPVKHRFYSGAKLVGFTDPNGFRCPNVAKCTWIFARSPSGNIEMVFPEVRHDPRPEIGDSEIWEIVDNWEIVDIDAMEAEHNEIAADTGPRQLDGMRYVFPDHGDLEEFFDGNIVPWWPAFSREKDALDAVGEITRESRTPSLEDILRAGGQSEEF